MASLPDSHIILNADLDEERENETIDIHYSDSGGTNDMKFSFISRISIPIHDVLKPMRIGRPILEFSADGSKFAMAMGRARVIAWDIRRKVPLQTFMEVPGDFDNQPL